MTSTGWIILRILPSLNVYLFYFLLLYNYRELSYRHDIATISRPSAVFRRRGDLRQAEEYTQKVCGDIESVTPKRFCSNRLVNLLCSSFSAKAERMEVRLKVQAAVPDLLAISNTELCALLSNGLENALNAAGGQEEPLRWVEFFCRVRMNKLLIEIKNPYTGRILFRDDLPAAGQPGHGQGCRSIHTITQTHRGLCKFSAEDGIFTLRVALPM